MNQPTDQQSRSLQETRTTLSPSEVLAEAKSYFARRNAIYAVFLEREGPTFLNFRGMGGEELIVGVQPDGEGTRVTASTYIFDQQVGRFFSTLPPAGAAATTVEAQA